MRIQAISASLPRRLRLQLGLPEHTPADSHALAANAATDTRRYRPCPGEVGARWTMPLVVSASRSSGGGRPWSSRWPARASASLPAESGRASVGSGNRAHRTRNTAVSCRRARSGETCAHRPNLIRYRSSNTTTTAMLAHQRAVSTMPPVTRTRTSFPRSISINEHRKSRRVGRLQPGLFQIWRVPLSATSGDPRPCSRHIVGAPPQRSDRSPTGTPRVSTTPASRPLNAVLDAWCCTRTVATSRHRIAAFDARTESAVRERPVSRASGCCLRRPGIARATSCLGRFESACGQRASPLANGGAARGAVNCAYLSPSRRRHFDLVSAAPTSTVPT